MNERERLINWAKQLADPNWCLSVPKEAKDVITQLVKEIEPRTITTVEELDALIAESVVRSDAGIIYERYADEDGPEFDYWLIPGEPRAQASTKIDLPALVIFDPEPQP